MVVDNVKTLVPWKAGTPEALLQQTIEVVKAHKSAGMKVGVATITITENADGMRFYESAWSEDLATEVLVYAARMLDADVMDNVAEENGE